MRDQHGFFQNTKSAQLEETKKVESQDARDEEWRLLQNRGRIREERVRFFRSLLNVNPEEAAAATTHECPRYRAQREGNYLSDEGNGKRESSGLDGPPAEMLKLGLQQDWTTLLELHRLITLM